jgi:hypothetical protein
VEPVKDWRSDCQEKQNLLVGEICGVLGRLHSSQGLAQSNNNATLNKGAKHDQKFLITSTKAYESKGSNHREGKRERRARVPHGTVATHEKTAIKKVE